MNKFLLITTLLACTHVRDVGVFYSERGISSAEAQWDSAYYQKLEECKKKFPPKTPEAEQCFRPMFGANTEVSYIVEKAIYILRDYWLLRAEGYAPDYSSAMGRVSQLFEKLPKSARVYFSRVKGIR